MTKRAGLPRIGLSVARCATLAVLVEEITNSQRELVGRGHAMLAGTRKDEETRGATGGPQALRPSMAPARPAAGTRPVHAHSRQPVASIP